MLSLDFAISAISRGQSGTCAILQSESGGLEFLGFGIRRPILWLTATIDSRTFSETDFPFYLFMRRGKGDKSAWAVLTNKELKLLAASDDGQHSIFCQALIKPQPPMGEDPEPPLCLLARFDATCAAVTVVQRDWDLSRIILSDSNKKHAVQLSTNQTEGVRNNDQHGTQSHAEQFPGW